MSDIHLAQQEIPAEVFHYASEEDRAYLQQALSDVPCEVAARLADSYLRYAVTDVMNVAPVTEEVRAYEILQITERHGAALSAVYDKGRAPLQPDDEDAVRALILSVQQLILEYSDSDHPSAEVRHETH